jgi:hypothetical protein
MTGNDTDVNHHAVDRFWHNYMFLLEKIPSLKNRDDGIVSICKNTLPPIPTSNFSVIYLVLSQHIKMQKADSNTSLEGCRY